MSYIYARIADQAIVEISSADPTPGFLDAIATNYGGVASDYTYFQLTAEQEERVYRGDSYALVWTGSSITGIDFSAEDNKKWVSFAVNADSAKVTLNTFDVSAVQIYNASETYVQGDLVFSGKAVYECQVVSISGEDPDTVVSSNWKKESSALLLTSSILMPDKITVDTTANFTALLNIRMPRNNASLELIFVDGVCKKVFVLNSTDHCGTWTIPGSTETHVVLNSTEYKVAERISFEGILPY